MRRTLTPIVENWECFRQQELEESQKEAKEQRVEEIQQVVKGIEKLIEPGAVEKVKVAVGESEEKPTKKSTKKSDEKPNPDQK